MIFFIYGWGVCKVNYNILPCRVLPSSEGVGVIYYVISGSVFRSVIKVFNCCNVLGYSTIYHYMPSDLLQLYIYYYGGKE